MLLPQPPSFRLDGQRALVTGGSRGIGLAAATALAQAGAHVTLVARSAPDLEQACQALRQAGLAADALVLDVTDSARVQREVSAYGPFQVLVNNAGMNRPRPLVDTPDADIDAVLDLNVKATFYVSRAVSRQLLAAGLPGSIINISSQMGHVGSPRRTLYCASKHAVEGMTKALAWELGPARIRVNTLCPTFIETDMTAALPEAQQQALLAQIPLGHLGQPADVAHAVAYLASPLAGYITGQELHVNGGMFMA